MENDLPNAASICEKLVEKYCQKNPKSEGRVICQGCCVGQELTYAVSYFIVWFFLSCVFTTFTKSWFELLRICLCTKWSPSTFRATVMICRRSTRTCMRFRRGCNPLPALRNSTRLTSTWRRPSQRMQSMTWMSSRRCDECQRWREAKARTLKITTLNYLVL